jgi:hypothetical protein
MISHIEEDETYQTEFMSSDEATFCVHGTVDGMTAMYEEVKILMKLH